MINLNKYSLGSTAAIITSMGLIAGLSHGEGSKASTIASLMIIAVADNISDSLSLHIYKESEGADRKEIASGTYGNFLARLLVVLTFVAIVMLFSANVAVLSASAWGLTLLTLLSYSIAKTKQTNPPREIVWHLVVAVLVIIASRLLGMLIAGHLG
jgi:VIT1/CCC1 family predicted Fe2+/Mn2+ transporter